jgi:hypothetical protein
MKGKEEGEMRSGMGANTCNPTLKRLKQVCKVRGWPGLHYETPFLKK